MQVVDLTQEAEVERAAAAVERSGEIAAHAKLA